MEGSSGNIVLKASEEGNCFLRGWERVMFLSSKVANCGKSTAEGEGEEKGN